MSKKQDHKQQFRALLDAGLSQAHALEVLGERAAVRPDWAPWATGKAENIYCFRTDDIEIDPKPLQSRADDGVWVSAWLWVADDAAKVAP